MTAPALSLLSRSSRSPDGLALTFFGAVRVSGQGRHTMLVDAYAERMLLRGREDMTALDA